jgi:dihydropteroate synthase
MGILNITPDSFSDGGQFIDPECALEQALLMEAEGADLIDIGAESTRPGASPVSVAEELRRLEPVLRRLAARMRIPVSIDTRHAGVARAAIDLGASQVNGISALGDAGMAEVVAQAQVPVILMHMKGEPSSMQSTPIHYSDVVSEILQYLEARIHIAEEAGVGRGNILADPGFGFGKRTEDNWTILAALRDFKRLEVPLVVGVSRKSFIRQKYGASTDQLLAGSVEVALEAASRGASILRVHDVKATRQGLKAGENLAKRAPFL